MKNKNNLRLQDPFLEREREKYENPLPSREFILFAFAFQKRVLLTQVIFIFH